jgi:hypothetical protein
MLVDRLTRYNIARVHGVFVLDEAEAVHQLDFRNLTRPMSTEVFFDVLLGNCQSLDSC